MADQHTSFGHLYDQIVPQSGKMAALAIARDAVRQRIRDHFQDVLKLPVPKFQSQGAYAMGTIIHPLSGVYDIDDGIYLQHLDAESNRDWPSPERVHVWIHTAAAGQSNEIPVNKKTCVRVPEPGGYRLDLPIYARLNQRYLLAECGAKGWHRSDPKALVDWFSGAVKTYGEQLRRVVRFLKAWAEFQSLQYGKMPGGLILTVLTVQNFFPDERDDVAVAFTLQEIESATYPLLYLHNPRDGSEELTARMSMMQRMRFQEAVASAASDAAKAIRCASPEQAADLWRRQFGDRFPAH
ncbi:MAG: hypothetical protein C4519_05210 [Desulfobacteraceae bacterium]|nr:MAG: hypothetical protein C4519_05210 [Desulfobacteraceae bacterium]